MKNQKQCARCRRDLDLGDFCKSSKSRDGRQRWCRDCMREYMRGRSSDPAKRRANARRSARRYPEKRRARERVKDAIRRGDLPRASACICSDCPRQATQYDHPNGYENALEVESVCDECHGLRSRRRGEHTIAGPVLSLAARADSVPRCDREVRQG